MIGYIDYSHIFLRTKCLDLECSLTHAMGLLGVDFRAFNKLNSKGQHGDSLQFTLTDFTVKMERLTVTLMLILTRLEGNKGLFAYTYLFIDLNLLSCITSWY